LVDVVQQPLGIKTFIPPPMPFFTQDWPLPKPAPIVGQIGQNVIVNTFQLTLIKGLDPPFYQNDWARLALRKIGRPDDIQNFLGLNPSKGIPLGTNDWPNPVKVKYQQIYDYRNLLVSQLAIPFKQNDWPQSVRKFYQYDYPVNLLALLAPVAELPFKQSDWASPKARMPIQDSPTQNLQTTTLALVAVAAPFSQTEWQIPARNIGLNADNTQNLLALLEIVTPPPTPPPTPSGGGGAGTFFIPQIGEKKKKRRKNDDNLLILIASIIPLIDDEDDNTYH
jgi:hypothetical protein